MIDWLIDDVLCPQVDLSVQQWVSDHISPVARSWFDRVSSNIFLESSPVVAIGLCIGILAPRLGQPHTRRRRRGKHVAVVLASVLTFIASAPSISFWKNYFGRIRPPTGAEE